MSAASLRAVEQTRPQALPNPIFTIAAVMAGLGAVAFIYGLATDPETAWRSFHVNTLYFAGIAQGGVVLSCIFTIVGAKWPGPIKRIAEGLGAWIPVTFVLYLIGFFFGRDYIYPWIAEPLPWKAAWLNETRLFVTDVLSLGLLTVLSHLYLRASLRQALKNSDAESTGFAKSMTERWTANWRGDEAEAVEADGKMRVLAVLICIFYAFGYSFLAFDMIMSLEPTWFSNLFGAFYAWGGFLCAVTSTALLAVLHRNYAGLEGEITKDRLHDLGKMIFAFSIFWMYLFFSQYIVIWYGNLPEETQFFKDRLGTEFLASTWYWEGWADRVFGEPWAVVTLFAWICIWVIPFWCLLGQAPKRTPWFLATISCISLFGFWIERNVLVWPSLTPDDTWAFLGPIQIGTWVGFEGAFILCFLVFTRVFPSLAVPRKA